MTALRVLLLCGVLAPPAVAYELDDVAGELDGQPVRLREIDVVLDGAVREQWREIDAIVQVATREICRARAVAQLAGAGDASGRAWRAALWTRTAPSPDAVRAWLAAASDPHPPGAAEVWAGHALRVRDYRAGVRAAADARLADGFEPALAPRDAVSGERALPDPVARCLERPVTRAELEAFASFPLFRRRAEVVALACRQFDVDYANRLALERAARAQQMTRDEYLRSHEPEDATPTADEVEAAALARYGRRDEVSLAKARLALEAGRRVEGRMGAMRALVASSRGSCALRGPPPPTAQLSDRSEPRVAGALRVLYFGNFRCQHCRPAWSSLEGVRERHAAEVRIELRHHFPDASKPAFDDALGAECSARQDRLREFARWRMSDAWREGARFTHPSLDERAARACERDAATAVHVLADAEEALRLGFREAIPSWVIGRRPRRGFQGDAVLDATIRAEQAKLSTASREERESR